MDFLSSIFPTATPDSGTPANRAGTLESLGSDVASAFGSALGDQTRQAATNGVTDVVNRFLATRTGTTIADAVTNQKIQTAASNPKTWFIIGGVVLVVLWLGSKLK